MTGVKVTARGPAVEKGKRKRILKDGGNRIVKALVELGEERLNKVLSPRPQGVFLSVGEAGPGKASTGNYRRNLNSVVRGLTGVLSDGGVVYGPWLESGRSSTRFRGYASFRKTKDFLNKERVRMGNKAIRVTVRKLNGF